jgi:Domain of unknown function (DUF6362)
MSESLLARDPSGTALRPSGATRPGRTWPEPDPQDRTSLSRGEDRVPAFDAELVIYRLEEAGRTLLALPHTGPSTRLKTSTLEIVRTVQEQFGQEETRVRVPVPSAARITRMDEALAWVPLIPRDRYVLRRIVGARCLVSPLTERHQFSWRRLGKLLGADHKAIQRWHAEGIDLIVAALNRAG